MILTRQIFAASYCAVLSMETNCGYEMRVCSLLHVLLRLNDIHEVNLNLLLLLLSSYQVTEAFHGRIKSVFACK
jgi:hypothetical protein